MLRAPILPRAVESSHPVYIASGAEPLYGCYHVPPTSVARDVAVLMCSPFGYDEMASYRSRRVWAQCLATAGYPTLRFDLPGTGDSGGATDAPGLFEAWNTALIEAAAWLRSMTESRRIVAVGIGLGGLLALRAATLGASIDDLALWGTSARGKAVVRELRTFGALEAAARTAAEQVLARTPADSPERPPLEGGAIEAGGFTLTADAVRALEGLDLTTDVLPDAGARRILLLERDGITVDSRLRHWLGASGAHVDVDGGEGYGAMTGQAHEARAPTRVIDRVTKWLGEDAAASEPLERPSSSRLTERDPGVELEMGEERLREEPFSVELSDGSLQGVLTRPLHRPATDLCVIFANVGALRRSGPGRMWVDAARRWAGRGVTCLRLDVPGVGDAAGDASRYGDLNGLYAPELASHVHQAVSELFARGVARRFVIVGLCSGAYWAFHCALQDSRVGTVVMINPAALVWDPMLGPARQARKFLKLRRPSQWRRIAQGAVGKEAMVHALGGLVKTIARTPFTLPARLAGRWRAQVADGDEIDHALDRLRERGQRAVLVFCSVGEPLLEELRRRRGLAWRERWSNVELELIPGFDHLLRPQSMQHAAHEILDRALELELRTLPARRDTRRPPAQV